MRVAACWCVWVLASLMVTGSPGLAESIATEEASPVATIPNSIPDELARINNPRRSTVESISNGKLYFSSQCTMCHGATGEGQGALVGRLGLTVPDLTVAGRNPKRTDGELFHIIEVGHGRMPGDDKNRLTKDVKWDIVNYIRSLEQQPSTH